MKFAYSRRGGPLLSWSGPSAPMQYRAADARSLGSFWPTEQQSYNIRQIGTPVRNAVVAPYPYHRAFAGSDIPRPGAPELLGGGCCGSMGDASSAGAGTASIALGALAAYLTHKKTKSVAWAAGAFVAVFAMASGK